MSPRTDHVVHALESGIRVVQQALFQSYRAPLEEVGLSLHFAAFTGFCLGAQHASENEKDVVDLHPRVEKALRHLCAAWDERPAGRRRLTVAGLLRRLSDDPDEPPGLQDSRAVSVAVPGVPRPERGDRGAYVVGRYRHYVDSVYIYSCDRARPNTWDEGGADFALERALFADVYGAGHVPAVDASRSVFGAVLRHYQTSAGDGAG